MSTIILLQSVFQVEVNCQCASAALNNSIIGTNNERGFTAERDRTFYLNTDDPAPCNGTINGWRYCFYNPDSIRSIFDYRATFAVYRADGTDYQRVSSVITVSWRGRDINRSQDFNCYNVSVDSFTVQAGDIVAACIYEPRDRPRQLDLVGRDVAGHFLMQTNSADQCRENSLPSFVSYNQLSTTNSRILHLYAIITSTFKVCILN